MISDQQERFERLIEQMKQMQGITEAVESRKCLEMACFLCYNNIG